MSETFYETCLKNLSVCVPEYIKKVGTFQIENEGFKLTNHYFVQHFDRCFCGHRIKEVFEVTSATKTLKVGNCCINKITNQKIARWFKDYERKKRNLEANKDLITSVHYMLQKRQDGTLAEYDIYISPRGVERLDKTLNRMCRGLNPIQEQVDLYNNYRDKIISAYERCQKSIGE